MEAAGNNLEKKYAGKEDEAMADALAMFSVMGEIEKNYPDAKEFSFSKD